MSEPAPIRPTTFEKSKDFAQRIIAVPREEGDQKEQEWREARKKAAERKKSADPL